MRPAWGAALWIVVAVVLADRLEAHMLTHSLVQIPLLAVSGALLAPRRRRNDASHPLAFQALLVGLFAASVWMLPRMLDETLSHREVEWAKLALVPALVGLPIGWSWRQVSGLTRSFVWANLVSMCLTLGWLYLEAPIRVCNFYVESEQRAVGRAYLMIAAAIVVYWLPRVFIGDPWSSPSQHEESAQMDSEELNAHPDDHAPRSREQRGTGLRGTISSLGGDERSRAAQRVEIPAKVSGTSPFFTFSAGAKPRGELP